ncbi:MAG TPA: nuclear transport factor 2 family protein [Solirubrobacterales bacterium]|nr:nuclear transport factor 2 family protein [Solirubrobacterales bacterium]
MPDSHVELVERLYRCFNQRDEGCIVELCDEEMSFFPVGTAEAVGREAPYSGKSGLHDYLTDVAEVWEELQITPSEVDCRGDWLLVRGRVYARSRDLGIRDVPIAWIWEVRNGRFVHGEVFPDPEEAAIRFASSAEPRSAAQLG